MPFNTEQMLRAIVDERELYEFSFGGLVERYTSHRSGSNAFGEEWTPLPIVRDGVASGMKAPSKCKVALRVRPAFVALVAEAGLAAISVRIFRGFGNDFGSNYRVPWFDGVLTDLSLSTTIATGTLESHRSRLKRIVPGVGYTPGCNNEFGDDICGANLVALTETRTITEIRERGRIIVIDGPIPANGTFSRGKARLVDSPTEVQHIVQQAGPEMVLHVALPGAVVGDQVQITPGCPRTLAACGSFGRLSSSVSFPGIPTENPVTGI